MRAFIAIELPLEIKNALAGIQEKLKTTLPKISWVKPANLHLSLKFLGEISSEQADNLQPLIGAIAKTTGPFEIKLETLGVFPNFRAGRVIWIGTHQAPLQLIQIVGRLEKELWESAIPKEERPFQTHITLARIKHSLSPSELEKAINSLSPEITGMPLKFDAGGITLFQSVLGPGGPAYSILKKADFKD